MTLNAGDSLYIPEGTAHTATNIGTTAGSELATYIVKKDTPLVVLQNKPPAPIAWRARPPGNRHGPI